MDAVRGGERCLLKQQEDGFVLVPVDPARTELLLRLCGYESSGVAPEDWLPAPVFGESLPACIARVRRVADDKGLRVRMSRRKDGNVAFALWDARESDVDLAEWMSARGMPIAEATWQHGGRHGKGAILLNGQLILRVKRGIKVSSKDCERAVDAVAQHFTGRKGLIWSIAQFLEAQGCETFAEFGRSLYKSTDCGPWVTAMLSSAVREHWDNDRDRPSVYYDDSKARENAWWPGCTGVEVGSIVEGSDVEVGPVDLRFPFTLDEFDTAVDGVNDEADFYWRRDNNRYFQVYRDDVLVLTGVGEAFGDTKAKHVEDGTGVDTRALAEAAGAWVCECDDDGERHPLPGWPGFEVELVDTSGWIY